MSIYLISDLHLSAERPETTRAFDSFIEQHANRAEALYILGDLFEAWIGDDDPSPLSRHVVETLARISQQGTRVYFQPGNRDFLVGSRFARETGARLLPDLHLATLYGHLVLMLHGDLLCLEDEAYQRFRRRVRLPLICWLLTRLPLRKRLQIAADWRARSAKANSNKPAAIMDVSPAEVERLMKYWGVDTMIHGHTHRPARHQLQIDGRSAERMVLGDWGKNTWIARATADSLQLLQLEQLAPAET